jgi:hypothetical protein
MLKRLLNFTKKANSLKYLLNPKILNWMEGRIESEAMNEREDLLREVQYAALFWGGDKEALIHALNPLGRYCTGLLWQYVSQMWQ